MIQDILYHDFIKILVIVVFDETRLNFESHSDSGFQWDFDSAEGIKLIWLGESDKDFNGEILQLKFSVYSDAEEGDALLAAEIGSEVGSLTGLGNGFDVDAVPDGAVLVADGPGVAELLELARSLLTRGKGFRAVLGFATKDDIYMMESFRNICNEIEIVTLDGSNGREGTPSDAVHNAEYVCASGSLSMLKKLVLRCREGQFSLSNQMLTTLQPEGNVIVPTRLGDTSSINDGPVYDKNEIRWNELNN